jgi:hypothetical protein
MEAVRRGTKANNSAHERSWILRQLRAIDVELIHREWLAQQKYHEVAPPLRESRGGGKQSETFAFE